MRVKVESVAPLPHVKAWFTTNAVPTILDLKTSFCSDLGPLSHERFRPQDILLLLDDFELLDSSAIDVLRDGDLIIIKKKPVSPTSKRKAPPQDVASPARKRTKIVDGSAPSQALDAAVRATSKPHAKSPSVSSSTDSSTDSESEDDSTDSDSDSESSSDSDSDSSESSSSSSASSKAGVSRKKTSGTPFQAKVAKPDGPPVPPGLGKPATHSRNLRRRRKKMYERLTATVEPASVNDIPLGARARTVDAVADIEEAPPELQVQLPLVQPDGKGKGKATEPPPGETPTFMMASLQNKNKRRGFKDALTQGVPPKIVFPDATNAEQPTMDVDQDAQIVEAALQLRPGPQEAATPRRAQPRLIPPSEKQERGQVPANIFVTSVDVEEGLWPTKGKNKKKKKAQAEKTWDYGEEDTFAGGLPYDDVPEVAVPANAVAQGDGAVAGSTEHAVVAAKWDALRKITDKAQVPPGTTVAWKALGINFTTLTPEMLLHVGRVVTSDNLLVLETFAEPGSAEVSFGGAVAEEEGGAVEETFEWSDVLSGDWRLVATR
ncbi:hypothetical protein C8Q78DRAFT_1073437 [Trametes maxima]|nr:hypothetical protein C8Q78DRAFT_1073437 [Trametes maxima]